MLVIGLTGSIGSGKSTVANLFAKLGAPVIDADVLAREVTMPHTPANQQISEHFGSEVINADGTLDRAALRDIIFSNPEERRWLEALLHPIILEKMREDIHKLNAPYCVAVIPLLLETDSTPFIQRILIVDLPEELQLKRASLRDNSSIEQIKSIINTQISRQERLARADDIINNAGTPADLTDQVMKLHLQYLKLGEK